VRVQDDRGSIPDRAARVKPNQNVGRTVLPSASAAGALFRIWADGKTVRPTLSASGGLLNLMHVVHQEDIGARPVQLAEQNLTSVRGNSERLRPQNWMLGKHGNVAIALGLEIEKL